MKILFLKSLLLLTACTALPVSAQEQGPDLSTVKTNTLSLGWGAAFNGVGIGYERCLSRQKQLYLQTGFGFGYSSMDWVTYNAEAPEDQQWQWGDFRSYSYTVPAGVTYLMGKKRSKFELGAGITASYHHNVYEGLDKTENKFSSYLFGNVGWRWQARSGFLFRIGVSPLLSINKTTYWANSLTFGNDDDNRFAVAPYFSFGWAF